MEGYTGEGEPPCIVMTLRAVSDETTLPDLFLPVTLNGVRGKDQKLQINRTAEGKLWFSSCMHPSSVCLTLYAHNG